MFDQKNAPGQPLPTLTQLREAVSQNNGAEAELFTISHLQALRPLLLKCWAVRKCCYTVQMTDDILGQLFLFSFHLAFIYLKSQPNYTLSMLGLEAYHKVYFIFEQIFILSLLTIGCNARWWGYKNDWILIFVLQQFRIQWLGDGDKIREYLRVQIRILEAPRSQGLVKDGLTCWTEK